MIKFSEGGIRRSRFQTLHTWVSRLQVLKIDSARRTQRYPDTSQGRDRVIWCHDVTLSILFGARERTRPLGLLGFSSSMFFFASCETSVSSYAFSCGNHVVYAISFRSTCRFASVPAAHCSSTSWATQTHVPSAKAEVMGEGLWIYEKLVVPRLRTDFGTSGDCKFMQIGSWRRWICVEVMGLILDRQKMSTLSKIGTTDCNGTYSIIFTYPMNRISRTHSKVFSSMHTVSGTQMNSAVCNFRLDSMCLLACSSVFWHLSRNFSYPKYSGVNWNWGWHFFGYIAAWCHLVETCSCQRQDVLAIASSTGQAKCHLRHRHILPIISQYHCIYFFGRGLPRSGSCNSYTNRFVDCTMLHSSHL